MSIVRSIILVICIILLSSSSSSVVLGFDFDSDSMPYDMSAVEQMEHIQQLTQNQQMKETMALLETHEQQQQRDTSMEPSPVEYAPVLNDPLTTEEQAFFSERDVDAFLEQRSKQQLAAQAKVEAAAKAEAEIEAQRRANAKAAAEATLRAAQEEKERHEQMIKETLEHPIEAANFAFDHLMPRPAFLEAESEFKQGLEQLQEHKLEEGQEQEFDLDLDVGAEVQGESEVDTTADDSAEAEHEQKAEAESDSEPKPEPAALVESKSKTVSTVDMESPEAMRLAREHFAEVEQAGLKALRRIEFMAKLKARDSQQGSAKESQHDQTKPMSFAETRAKSRSSSTASQPWWSSKAGVSSNFQHYRQGVKNSLLQVGSSTKNGQVPNAAGSYSLPLGKSVGAARLNQKKVPAQMAAPVQAYPVIPVQEQGSSLAFNPYSGAEFHPPIAVPAHAPKLPEYMAESQQPFAGAGYYGSGGGQGPHPGSEAFLPLPGVSGKEFGIRAREAWEEHAQKYANDPTGFHNVANQPPYPYFPAWSRESEIGGRPDIFPKPMYNLPTVNKIAQAAGEAAYHHSQLYYPQLNRPITTPAPFVDAARVESVVGTGGISPSATSVPIRGYRQPRLIRAVTGYPRPQARTSWSGTIPEQFPQPLDSNTFDENVNYAPTAPRPTLGVPHMPAQFPLRNIMVNSGPDKGLHPIYGGFPQYIPVPVAARAENDVVAAH